MSLRASVLQCLADAQYQSEAVLATAEDLYMYNLRNGAGELRRAAKESYPALLHRLHTFSKCAKMDIKKDL
ncbi:hypothetical protein PR001_g23339 [Phytophthora rubi]|uniref:Uncharacterized protein n=1 Tax=Phytophthora rubi TaxID=129364 RepID=A0A6A3J9G5_9STRA|nr:hypothetical protein PR001_g23339 [Phytophthora rubi]KAE8990397.1 hypothetical protein PR002_g21166 [Phytophthora rubi]